MIKIWLSRNVTSVSVNVNQSIRLLDSACCNHITPYPSFFSHTSFAHHAPTIHTTNGSTMLVRIGTVSTSKLSISDVFHMPKLSYNLLSLGQLAELGYRIILDYFGCIVQDHRTGQELGTGRRIGRLFEISSLVFLLVVSLLLPHLHLLSLWHSRLGHHHLPGYNSQSLRVYQVQCLRTILIVFHVNQENNQFCLFIIMSPCPLEFFT